MLKSIVIEHLLPDVFRGSEAEPPVSSSEVWLAPRLQFNRGDRYIIEAESGTGKSSLCAFIYGSRRDYQGRILFDGVEARSLSLARWGELRRRSLAYLPQELALFPELSALDNILAKNALTDFKSALQIKQMLECVGLDGRENQLAATLSVGQQQRVAIVRALCQPFDFLLIDEPVSHLDARSNAAVARLIDNEASAQGAAVIATSVGNKISLSDMSLLHL